MFAACLSSAKRRWRLSRSGRSLLRAERLSYRQTAERRIASQRRARGPESGVTRDEVARERPSSLHALGR